MTGRARFWIPSALSPAEYHSLLFAVAAVSSTFGMVQRSSRAWDTYPESTIELLNRLEPYLVDISEVTEWPGTKTCGSAVSRFLFKSVEQAISIVAQATDSLWDWANTRLPDDLHFLRMNGSVVMGSTWCTLDAWLDIDREEEIHIRQKLMKTISLVRAVDDYDEA